MTFGDERIEVDHLDMTVKRFENGFPSDTGGEGGDSGEVRFFRHDVDRRMREKWLMWNHLSVYRRNWAQRMQVYERYGGRAEKENHPRKSDGFRRLLY